MKQKELTISNQSKPNGHMKSKRTVKRKTESSPRLDGQQQPKSTPRGEANRSKVKSFIKRKSAPPRTASEYFARPDRFKDTWEKVISVVSTMRSDQVSLTQASHELGISPRTVLRWGKSALRKKKSGKYAAKSKDNLLRVLQIPTSEGTVEIGVRGSKDASLLAEYWNAVHHYLQTGDTSRLHRFRCQQIIDADGVEYQFITDPRTLNRLGSAGVLSFESLYARTI